MGGPLENSRRYEITKRGRMMTLRRGQLSAIQVRAMKWNFKPEQLTGGVLQGDCQVEIMNDEMAIAGFPGPPRRGDSMIIDGRTWTVQGNEAQYEASTLFGHSIWVRGG